MPPFTDEQRALIREIAREIVNEAGPSLIRMHVLDCPYGKRIVRGFYVALGVGIGAGFLSGGFVAVLLRGTASL